MPASSPAWTSLSLGFEALLLGPAQIHAHQHLGPILALGAAGAGVDGDDGVERIGFAVEHGAGFEVLVESGESLDIALEIGEDILALAGQLEVGIDVAGAADELLVVGDEVLKALAVAHQGLGRGGIVPEGWIGESGFYVGEFPADASRVKDTPAGRAFGRAREHMRIRDRSTTTYVCSYDLTLIWTVKLRSSSPISRIPLRFLANGHTS